MMDLHNLDELKQACADAIKTAQMDDHHAQWGQRLRDFLTYVRDADLEKRASEECQRRIWEENPVSAVGMGTIPIEAAIKDPDFRGWIAEQSQRPLPEAEEARRVALDELYTGIQDKIEKYTNRRPRIEDLSRFGRFLSCRFHHNIACEQVASTSDGPARPPKRPRPHLPYQRFIEIERSSRSACRRS